MPQPSSTAGSKTFAPENLFDDSAIAEKVHEHLNQNDLRSAITKAFGLPVGDSFTYHAIASVNLQQVQGAINAGSVNGLHDWYFDESNNPVGHPPGTDIGAYISIFDPSKSSVNTLKSFQSNAKKESIRASIAEYLVSKRHVDSSITVSKRKTPHVNPYVDFWAWSCHSLEYAGPNKSTANVKTSHHVLPIFMHHFGCVCPSYEALEIMSKLCNGKKIIDMGSGNGYWTLMLRRHGCDVTAVDSQQSQWRTNWIDDTITSDGVQYLKKKMGARDDVLLMVYPIVGGDFTEKVLEAFKGNIICVAGTQNGNGYTGFKNQMIDGWMNDHRADFTKIVQIPLPSFAGKDDALFIFRRQGIS